MTSPSRRPGVYYGWYIVGACSVVLGVEAGAAATFPVFFKPLIDEFGWSRTALSGTVSIGLIVGGLTTPFWGSWTDRSGVRVVVLTAALFSGLSLFLRGQIATLLQLYAVVTLGALFFAGVGLIPLSTAISHWFRGKRGLAMGLTVVGGGVGESIAPPLTSWLVELFGWRQAYALLAAAFFLTLLPIAGLILRRRPQDLGLLPDGEAAPAGSGEDPGDGRQGALAQAPEGARAAELDLRQAVRTLPFWLIATAFFLPMMSGIGLFTHLVAIFTDMGTSARTAAVALGAIGLAADRFSVRKVFATCYVIEAIGVSLLLATPWLGTQALFAYVVVYGLTVGGGLVLAPLIVGECFGILAMGSIFGVLAIAAVVGGAIGPVLAGLVFDSMGTYYPVFVIFTLGEATAALAISRARPPEGRTRMT
jgi:MFS family permease